MYCLEELIQSLNTLAPTSLAEDWDNVGLMIGSRKSPMQRVLCALDINKKVIEEAVSQKIDCIVTHHPFLFSPIKQIDYDTAKGEMIRLLIEHHIAVYSMHTNLDSARGGINDVLAKLLELSAVQPLHSIKDNKLYKLNAYREEIEKIYPQQKIVCDVYATEDNVSYEGLGRYGEVESISLKALALKAKALLQTPYVRIIGDKEKIIKKVALCSGSGSEFIETAAKVADVFITGDIKFHDAQSALEKGLFLIDVGHYPSENIMMPHLKTYIEQCLPELDVCCSQVNGEVFEII